MKCKTSKKKNYQKIQLTKGCPNNCSYCYEPTEQEFFDIPKIINNYVQILDMNLLSNPNAKQIIYDLGQIRVNNKVVYYELVCGIDFRLLDEAIANLLHQSRFIKMRWAWDYSLAQQKIHQKTKNILVKAGYRSKYLSVFIILNWKVSFIECFLKLELLKTWSVKVNDCCYDGGYARAKPKDWDIDQIKLFRALCALHNQIINFEIYPDMKRALRLKQIPINNLIKYIDVKI